MREIPAIGLRDITLTNCQHMIMDASMEYGWTASEQNVSDTVVIAMPVTLSAKVQDLQVTT